MSKKDPLCVLNSQLWVPTDLVTQEAKDDYTHTFDKVEYQPRSDLPRMCMNCDLWGKKWRPGKTTCESKGYMVDDLCSKFLHKSESVHVKTVLKTYKHREDGWSVFARGDLSKIRKHFGALGIDDQRSAPPLPYNLVCHRELYAEQKEVVRQWLDKGYGIIKAPTGFGKCLGRGTPVLMYDGTIKPVEEVQRGNLLIGPDGTARTVTSTCQGREPLYQVTPDEGDSYVVNESHILSLRIPTKNYDKDAVVNIEVRDYIEKGSEFREKAKGWKVPIDFSQKDPQKKKPLVTNIRVEPVGEGDYFGFELSGPDRLFLLGDFTVTHNTVMWAWLVAHLQTQTLLLAQEVRHLMVGFEGMYEHTNIAELEEEAGEHLIGVLGKDWEWRTDEEGDRHRHFLNRPGKVYPITFSTFQALASKKGKKIRRELKNNFGMVWQEECVTGDTLIPTVERGLVRIDDMAKGDSQNIDITVGTRYGEEKAVRWIYQGYQPTLKITSFLQNSVTCTYSHNMLVLDPMSYDFAWKEAQDIRTGDMLCVPQSSITRKRPLEIEWTAPTSNLNHARAEIIIPHVMTEDLAFIMAFIVSKGGVYSSKNSDTTTPVITVTNTDVALLEKYMECMERTFGLKSRIRVQCPEESPIDMRGDSHRAYSALYEVSTSSVMASDFLTQLGVEAARSSHRQIPWAILQSTKEHQEAFIASYVECGGGIGQECGHIGVRSSSRTLITQFQAMLFSHGYSSCYIEHPCEEGEQSHIRMSVEDSSILYDRIKNRLVTKTLRDVNTRSSSLLGIPAQGVLELFRARKGKESSNKRRREFVHDDGSLVRVAGAEEEFVYDHTTNSKGLTYFESGDRVIAQLMAISPSMGDKLAHLRDLKYRYVEVASIEEAGEQEVFDITVADSDNRSFIANGLISSNCHHSAAKTFYKAARSFNPKYRGGQTATPTRKDKTHVAIYDMSGPVTAIGTKEQMNPEVQFHSSNILVPDSTFRRQYVMPILINFLAANAVYQELVYETIVSDIEEDRKILVITERKNHALRLKQKLELEGFGCELMMGGMKLKEQNWYAEKLLSGEVSVIIGTSVINENVNIPPWDSIHLPFPNFGKEREEQRVGRIRRYLSGTNKKFLKDNEIEWEKPQPRVHVYTWHSSNDMASKAVNFRKNLYRSWGFDFAQSTEAEIKKKRAPKTMKDWLKECEDD